MNVTAGFLYSDSLLGLLNLDFPFKLKFNYINLLSQTENFNIFNFFKILNIKKKSRNNLVQVRTAFLRKYNAKSPFSHFPGLDKIQKKRQGNKPFYKQYAKQILIRKTQASKIGPIKNQNPTHISKMWPIQNEDNKKNLFQLHKQYNNQDNKVNDECQCSKSVGNSHRSRTPNGQKTSKSPQIQFIKKFINCLGVNDKEIEQNFSENLKRQQITKKSVSPQIPNESNSLKNSRNFKYSMNLMKNGCYIKNKVLISNKNGLQDKYENKSLNNKSKYKENKTILSLQNSHNIRLKSLEPRLLNLTSIIHPSSNLGERDASSKGSSVLRQKSVQYKNKMNHLTKEHSNNIYSKKNKFAVNQSYSSYIKTSSFINPLKISNCNYERNISNEINFTYENNEIKFLNNSNCRESQHPFEKKIIDCKSITKKRSSNRKRKNISNNNNNFSNIELKGTALPKHSSRNLNKERFIQTQRSIYDEDHNKYELYFFEKPNIRYNNQENCNSHVISESNNTILNNNLNLEASKPKISSYLKKLKIDKRRVCEKIFTSISSFNKENHIKSIENEKLKSYCLSLINKYFKNMN